MNFQDILAVMTFFAKGLVLNLGESKMARGLFLESPKNFLDPKSSFYFVKLATTCFWKADLLTYFKVTKSKMTVEFDDLNPLCS